MILQDLQRSMDLQIGVYWIDNDKQKRSLIKSINNANTMTKYFLICASKDHVLKQMIVYFSLHIAFKVFMHQQFLIIH